jgi:hypothetical protein
MASRATDYAVQVSIADTQSANFPSPSFSAGASNMTGGNSGNGNAYAYQVGGYAPNGNILSHTDSVMGMWSFGYDTLNRLTAAQNTGVAAPFNQYAGVNGCLLTTRLRLGQIQWVYFLEYC